MLMSLIFFVVIATITPGGATTLATASGVQFGFQRSLPLIFGIVLGLASLAAISAAGLGAVLNTEPSLKWLLKAIGSAYLLYLACRIGASEAPGEASDISKKPMSVMGGALLLWLNPKAWAMTLGAAASFGALAHNAFVFAGTLGAAFGIAAVLSLSLWCALGRTLAKSLRTRKHWRIANISLGAILALSILPLWLE